METLIKRHTTAVYRNSGSSASYDSFVVGSSAFLRLNFCAKIPPLRKAANFTELVLQRLFVQQIPPTNPT